MTTPAGSEHITRAHRHELGNALTAVGLSREDNSRQATPQRLTYTATPRGREWSIRPVTGRELPPWQPSGLWRAVCAVTRHHSPVMSAQALADHIQEFPA